MFRMRARNFLLSVLFMFLLCSVPDARDEMFVPEQEMTTNYEFGMNLGSIVWKNKESFFSTESSFYPELCAWANLNGAARIGITTGVIYLQYKDPLVNKTIFLMPTILEVGLIQLFRPEFDEGPQIFAQFCLGFGYNINPLGVGDIYESSNMSSSKIGIGLISEGLFFSLDIKGIYCKARTKEAFTYKENLGKENERTVSIGMGKEMNLESYTFTIGVGMRY